MSAICELSTDPKKAMKVNLDYLTGWALPILSNSPIHPDPGPIHLPPGLSHGTLKPRCHCIGVYPYACKRSHLAKKPVSLDSDASL